jgi:hypothetical protein
MHHASVKRGKTPHTRRLLECPLEAVVPPHQCLLAPPAPLVNPQLLWFARTRCRSGKVRALRGSGRGGGESGWEGGGDLCDRYPP